MTAPEWWDPYRGLEWYIQVVFYIILAITASSLISVLTLRLNGVRGRRFLDEESVESQFLWVFMVPALNEDVTIADSVSRLQQTQATHRVILVIDDGSDDGTAGVLASIDYPDLHVLHRVMPEARKGKSAALNDAWNYLHHTVLSHYPTFSIDHVLVVVVDADGRLSANAPAMFSRHFRDPRVAGVQSRVRIYNRRSWLTWCQDIEFSIFAAVFQLGRSAWGTANMGGNGQANRLAALDSVANEEGPWRHRLTEDQDIGVRLIEAGWRGAQDLDATVEQQGCRTCEGCIDSGPGGPRAHGSRWIFCPPLAGPTSACPPGWTWPIT